MSGATLALAAAAAAAPDRDVSVLPRRWSTQAPLPLTALYARNARPGYAPFDVRATATLSRMYTALCTPEAVTLPSPPPASPTLLRRLLKDSCRPDATLPSRRARLRAAARQSHTACRPRHITTPRPRLPSTTGALRRPTADADERTGEYEGRATLFQVREGHRGERSWRTPVVTHRPTVTAARLAGRPGLHDPPGRS